MIDALFVLYASRELGLNAAAIGLVVAAAGPGSFIGSLVATRVAQRVGLGRTIWGAQILTGIARLLVPIAAGGVLLSATWLAASMFLLGVARTVFNVNQVSLRLAITEDRMHGRLNATMRFVMWGVTPLGALAGGLLATTGLGVRGTLAVAGAGTLLAAIPFLTAALRSLREVPSSGVASPIG
jgi:predicted MFS family arabinose efflux permease